MQKRATVFSNIDTRAYIQKGHGASRRQQGRLPPPATRLTPLQADGFCAATFSYDSEGHYLGPQEHPGMPYGSSVTYSTDTLGRPTGITASPLNQDDDFRQVVKDVLYGPAGELQQMRVLQDPAPGSTSAYVKQTFSYNNLLQMTQQTAIDEESGGSSTTLLNLEYRYTEGQNNGRITQLKDWVSGEQVSYTYDNLNRLIQALTDGPEYGLNWTYDGFGNQTSQEVFKGTGYNTNLSYDGLTNRIATPGYAYDANGNLTAMPALTMSYNVQNRMTQSVQTTSGTKLYAYAPNGQRVAQSDPPHTDFRDNTWLIYFYGPDGSRIADCWAGYEQTGGITATCSTAYVYFGGKLVRKENKPVRQEDGLWVYPPGTTLASDRLGSTRYAGGTTTSYYPYGEERTPTTNDTQKFATYTRDSATGLDYANARYYSPQIARFTTPDPYKASAGPKDPQSWNRYAYTRGDPVNRIDPAGLADFSVTGYCYGCSDPPVTADPASPWGVGTSVMSSLGARGFDAAEIVEGNTEANLGSPGLGPSLMAYLNMLRETLLMPAVAGAVQRLSEPDCAAMFGGLPADQFLQSAFNDGVIRFFEFGSDIGPGVAAQTAAPFIQIGMNRFFVTGLVPGPTGATSPGSGGNPSVGMPIQGFISVTNPPPGIVTGFQGMSMDQMRQAVLIHELLHLLGIVGDDTQGQRITLPNGQTVYGSSGVTAAVRQNCFH